MREILFRGKTLTNEWVYGAYYKQEEYYGDKEDAHCIITSNEVLSYDQALDFSVVIPETIGQYTGLTDHNGQKIWEGDIAIVKHNRFVEPKPFVVEWNFGDAGWNWKDAEGNTDAMWSSIAETAEVIGNIHDNPELLGGDV